MVTTTPGLLIRLVAASALLWPSAALAQASGERVRLLVSPPARDAGMHEGRLVRLDADSVVLAQHDGTRALARGDVARVWVRGRRTARLRRAATYGLPLGALGALIGYTIGSSRAQERYCPDEMPFVRCTDDVRNAPRELALAGFATFGGAGAWYGATVASRGWVPAREWHGASVRVTPQRLTLSMPVGR